MIPLAKQKISDNVFCTGKNRNKKISFFICSLLIVLLNAQSVMLAAQKSQGRTVSESQQDTPIQLRSDLVEVRAVVTDKQGKLVKNLRKEDFEIVENGKAQEISFFSAESLGDGKSPVATTPKPPSEKSGVNAVEVPERTIVLFVDTLHISSVNLLRMQSDLLKFIDEKLTDRDLAAVVPSSGSLGVFSQFTHDKQVLRNAVNRLSIGAIRSNSLYTPFLASRVENEATNGNSLQIALETAINIVVAEQRLPDPNDPHLRQIAINAAIARAREILAESTFQRRSTLLTLKAVAEQLAQMPGQRMLLMLSEGFSMLDNSGVSDSSDLQTTISRAARTGVVINTFSAKGLSTLSFFDVSRGGFTPDSTTVNNMLQFANAGDRELEVGMTRLAKETGGEAFLTTNDLKGALEKALDANTFYYALSYYPSNNDEKDTTRRVKVRVKGHPEYEVRAQTGYLATPLKLENLLEANTPQQTLLQAINSPLASTAIEVDATADFLDLQTDDAQVSLSVYTDGKKLKYLEDNKSYLSKLMLLTEVIDARGNSQGITQDEIQIRLSPEQYKQATQNVYRYNKRLALKPGLYQIRLGVRDTNTELIGTSMTWVEIPKANANKLILSSISFEKFALSNASSQKEAKPIVVPLTVRRGLSLFRNTDFIAFFCTAYNTASIEKEAGELTVRVQILQDSKTVLEDVTIPFSSLVIQKENNAVKFGSQVNLKNLKAGMYEMRITVANQKAKRTATVNKLFEIEP
jgi:VWFA-related protein